MPDPLADWIDASGDSNEAYIKRLALTDATVATMPSGDLRKALKALGAVLEAASCWEGHTAAYCADEARMLITRELLTEEAERA